MSTSTKTMKTVTVQHRGPFNDDEFFKDSWDEWDSAMQDAVDRWNRNTGDAGKDLIHAHPTQTKSSIYRKIRSSNVSSDDSQAVACTEEDDKYKIVIDVKDYNCDDIDVKTVDDTIVVEGKIEKKENNFITTNKFTRRFLLPAGCNVDKVSSALSRDGVLTINAPKQVERSHREIEDMMRKHTLSPDVEVPLPISHEMAPASTIPPLKSAGVNVSKDVIRSGNKLTHRQEQKWEDQPAPGVSRKNRDYQESSDIFGDDGEIIGNKKKKEQESRAEGHREEILPDGTKCKIFTKSYETKNSYVASRGHPKAL